jgi:hypothetical protein
MIYLLISLFIGAVLGLAQGFKVLVLLPAVAIALVLAIANGIAHADSSWWIVLKTVAAVGGIQIGYLVGIGVRSMAPMLTSRSTVTSSPTTSARHSAR